MKLRKSDLIVIIGRKRSGKTYLTKNFILPKLRRFCIYDTINEYDDVPAAKVENMRDFYDMLECKENIRIPRDSKISFAACCETLYHVGGYYLVVDEFHAHYPGFAAFESENHYFKELVLAGRHREAGLVLITQRPKQYPPYVITQADHVFGFYVFSQADARSMEEICGEHYEKLLHLKKYQYLHVQVDNPIQVHISKYSLDRGKRSG